MSSLGSVLRFFGTAMLLHLVFEVFFSSRVKIKDSAIVRVSDRVLGGYGYRHVNASTSVFYV